mmetsp:Transcript_24633/g.68668  ORF Transcript_24633/g.68668 Transcript_24633/m.68668 type:complete len:208 (+) Transcript_24633:266-889(+)
MGAGANSGTRAHHGGGAFLHGQVSGHLRELFALPLGDRLPPNRHIQLAQELEWRLRKMPRRPCRPASHLRLVERGTSLLQVGWRSFASQLGVAVRGSGHRRPQVPVGQRRGSVSLPCVEQGEEKSWPGAGHEICWRRRLSIRRVRPRWQRVAIHRRVPGRPYTRRVVAGQLQLSADRSIPSCRRRLVLPPGARTWPAQQVLSHGRQV